MKRIIMFKVYKGETYYTAECLDLPVVTQGQTLDEVVENVEEATALHLEGENVREWDILPDYSILVNLELEPVHAKT
jgi:predicted RNase H-like HicB family nuclease